MRLLRSTSGWILLALLVCLLLQWIPFTGMFLMFVGAPLIAGFLVHVFLASVAVESLTGRLPRLCLVLPVLAYGSYYTAYLLQGYLIAAKEAELSSSNPRLLLQFDPVRHTLVMPHAGRFVQDHAIDVAYEPNPNYREQHLSYRLFRREECDRIKGDSQSRILKSGSSFDGKNQRHICELRRPESPSRNQIKITLRGDPQVWKRKWSIQEQPTGLEFEGRVLGSYTTAYAWRLPAFPSMFIGCGLVSSKPAWSADSTSCAPA